MTHPWLNHPVPDPLPETLKGLDYGEDYQMIYAIQARWKAIAIAEKSEITPFTDLALFTADVKGEIEPHVVEFRPAEVQLHNHRWLGSAFYKTLAEFRAARNDWTVDVAVKTGRSADFNGVENPTDAAMEAMKRVAGRWGLGEPSWEPNEKGWGTFSMKVTPLTSLVSLLQTMTTEETHTWVLPNGTPVKVFRGPGGYLYLLYWHPEEKPSRRLFPTAIEMAEALEELDPPAKVSPVRAGP